jgi:hypothetical protein
VEEKDDGSKEEMEKMRGILMESRHVGETKKLGEMVMDYKVLLIRKMVEEMERETRGILRRK